VTLMEAIHIDIKAPGDIPKSIISPWLLASVERLWAWVPPEDIYPPAERVAKLIASGAMSTVSEALRDQWLVFVVSEALACARLIAVTTRPYWRLTEAACDLTIAALMGEGSPGVAAQAAEAAQAAAYHASLPMPMDEGAKAEERSAQAAEAAARAAGAACAVLAGKPYASGQVVERAADAAQHSANGWLIAAFAIGDRDQAAAEAGGTLDAYFEEANHPDRISLISEMSHQSMFAENFNRRLLNRLLDDVEEHAKSPLTPPRA
jgi:hypothetical protein